MKWTVILESHLLLFLNLHRLIPRSNFRWELPDYQNIVFQADGRKRFFDYSNFLATSLKLLWQKHHFGNPQTTYFLFEMPSLSIPTFPGYRSRGLPFWYIWLDAGINLSRRLFWVSNVPLLFARGSEHPQVADLWTMVKIVGAHFCLFNYYYYFFGFCGFIFNV